MIQEAEISMIDCSRFQILEQTPHMIWIRSNITSEEFIITDYRVASGRFGTRHGFAWNVYHRHCTQELCHYHANERSFFSAMRHINAHDRKAAWKLEQISYLSMPDHG